MDVRARVSWSVLLADNATAGTEDEKLVRMLATHIQLFTQELGV